MNFQEAVNTLTSNYITAQFVDVEPSYLYLRDGVAWQAILNGEHQLSAAWNDPVGAQSEADAYWLSIGHKRISAWVPGGMDYQCYVAI